MIYTNVEICSRHIFLRASLCLCVSLILSVLGGGRACVHALSAHARVTSPVCPCSTPRCPKFHLARPPKVATSHANNGLNPYANNHTHFICKQWSENHPDVLLPVNPAKVDVTHLCVHDKWSVLHNRLVDRAASHKQEAKPLGCLSRGGHMVSRAKHQGLQHRAQSTSDYTPTTRARRGIYSD
jgi:hypothetical protein